MAVPHLVTADYTRGDDPSLWHRHTYFEYFPEPNERSRRAVSDGERSLLIILPAYLNASLSYDADDVFRTMWRDSAASVFEASSYGRVTYPESLGAVVSVDVQTGLGPYCTPFSYTDYILDHWHTFNVSVNASLFDSILTFVPEASGCAWGGLAFVNGCSSPGNTFCRAWVVTNDATTIAHELGHTIHFNHASLNEADDGTNSVEYGDGTDVMGSSPAPVHFNFVHATEHGFTNWAWYDNSACTTVTVSALHVAPSPGTIHGVLAERFPSFSEIAAREAFCNTTTCPADRSAFSVLSILGSSVVARTTYYVSYRGYGGLDANLSLAHRRRVYVHAYANDTGSEYAIDNSRLVASIGRGEKWRGTTLRVRVVSTSDGAATIRFCPHDKTSTDTTTVWIIVGSIAASFLLIAAFLMVVIWNRRSVYPAYDKLPSRRADGPS